MSASNGGEIDPDECDADLALIAAIADLRALIDRVFEASGHDRSVDSRATAGSHWNGSTAASSGTDRMGARRIESNRESLEAPRPGVASRPPVGGVGFMVDRGGGVEERHPDDHRRRLDELARRLDSRALRSRGGSGDSTAESNGDSAEKRTSS